MAPASRLLSCGAGGLPCAVGACLAVLGPGFLLPVGQLSLWTLKTLQTGQLAPAFGTLLLNTLYLAGLATGLACLMAVVLAYASRLHPHRACGGRPSVPPGYALPGSVIAVGVLLPLAWLDHTVIVGWLDRLLGRSGGLLLTGLGSWPDLCLFGTLSRRQPANRRCQPHQYSSESRRRGALLGASGRMLRRVHLPLMRRGLLTALILVFVEVMKEMPATLLLRPFGLNTLAVEVWKRTSEAMWQEAAVPALAIVAAGILPVLLAVQLSARR